MTLLSIKTSILFILEDGIIHSLLDQSQKLLTKCHSTREPNVHNIYEQADYADTKKSNQYVVTIKKGGGNTERVKLLEEKDFLKKYYPEKGVIVYPPVYDRKSPPTILGNVVMLVEEACMKTSPELCLVIPSVSVFDGLQVIGIDPARFGIVQDIFDNNIFLLDQRFHTVFVMRVTEGESYGGIRTALHKLENDCVGLMLIAQKFIGKHHLTVHGMLVTVNMTKKQLYDTLRCKDCAAIQHITKEDLSNADQLKAKFENIHLQTKKEIRDKFSLQEDLFLQICNLFMLLKSCYREGLPKVRGDDQTLVNSILLNRQQVQILNDPALKKIIKGIYNKFVLSSYSCKLQS